MLTGLDADVDEVVGEPVRALVELAVGQAPVAGDEREAVGNRVGDDLEQVREVEFHGADYSGPPTS